MKKLNYASMFTRRKDGRYMGYWHDAAGRHAIYDRDPQRLYERIKEKETPAKTTLADVMDLWEAAHREDIKHRTWMNYAPHVQAIKDLYGKRPIDELSAFDVTQDLLAAKAKGYSYTVVNSRRSIWRMVFDFAVGQRLIAYNPALSVKNPKGLPKGKRSVPEEEALSAILAGANDMDFGFIPFFLLCTGVRRSEGLQAMKSSVDTSQWILSIPKAKTDAGVRTVPLIEPLRSPLKAWMEAHPGDYLFPRKEYYAGRKGSAGYMTDSNWETAWLKYCEDHGWIDEDGKPTFGAHNLRHGTATLLYEAGVDVYTAQRILGHASVSTTMEIYTELRRKHEQKNVAKFSRSLSKMLSKKSK